MIRSAREGVPDDAVNVHASVVVLDDAAVMIMGRAGAGKTHLALDLLQQWHAEGRFARLVADDQVFVMRRGDRLVAQTPLAIAGLAEVRGVGVVQMPYQQTATVGLVVSLVDGAGDGGTVSTIRIATVELPLLTLPSRDSIGARARVAATLATIGSISTAQIGQNMLASSNDLGLPSRDGRTT